MPFLEQCSDAFLFRRIEPCLAGESHDVELTEWLWNRIDDSRHAAAWLLALVGERCAQMLAVDSWEKGVPRKRVVRKSHPVRICATSSLQSCWIGPKLGPHIVVQERCRSLKTGSLHGPVEFRLELSTVRDRDEFLCA